MTQCDCHVETLEDLHAFVHTQLCSMENLLEEQFITHQRPLITREQLCGIEFSLQGLRSIRLGAIWASDSNHVYFYNARGERHLKVQLSKRLSLEPVALSN